MPHSDQVGQGSGGEDEGRRPEGQAGYRQARRRAEAPRRRQARRLGQSGRGGSRAARDEDVDVSDDGDLKRSPSSSSTFLATGLLTGWYRRRYFVTREIGLMPGDRGLVGQGAGGNGKPRPTGRRRAILCAMVAASC